MLLDDGEFVGKNAAVTDWRERRVEILQTDDQRPQLRGIEAGRVIAPRKSAVECDEFLDYDGTHRRRDERPSGARFPAKVPDGLAELIREPWNVAKPCTARREHVSGHCVDKHDSTASERAYSSKNSGINRPVVSHSTSIP
jgi:hypothetical protein